MKIALSLAVILAQFQLITVMYEYSRNNNQFTLEAIIIMIAGTICIMAVTLF